MFKEKVVGMSIWLWNRFEDLKECCYQYWILGFGNRGVALVNTLGGWWQGVDYDILGIWRE